MGTLPTIDVDPSTPRRHRAGLIGLLLLVLTGTAAIAIVALVGVSTPSPHSVQVVGDSIAFYAGTDISAAFGGGYHVDVHSGIGRRIDEMLPTLHTAIERHPDAVVVDLGTNDAREAHSHPDWRTGFDRMIQMLLPERCVVLATVSTLVVGEPGADKQAAAINDRIAAEVAIHRNLHIADWNTAVHGIHGAQLLQPDRVHPSAAGQLTLAALVRTALDHDCPHA
jgi:lysophospholipase L1-like esterase